MSDALWYAGACDWALLRVQWWIEHWRQGEEYAERDYMTPQGEVRKVVTKRLLYVPFKPEELQHVVRILETLRPDWSLTADLKVMAGSAHKRRLIAGGLRLIPIASYEQDPRDILEVLLQAKKGALEPVLPDGPGESGRLWE